MSWRKNLSKEIKPYVEKLVRESFLYSNEYQEAEDKGKAQLWIALALISKQLSEIESKLKLFEAILKDISPKKAIKIRELEKDKEKIEKIFRNIVQGKPITPANVASAKSRPSKKASKRKPKRAVLSAKKSSSLKK